MSSASTVAEKKLPLSLEEVNNLTLKQFIKIFGDVVELYSFAAYGVWGKQFHNVMDVYAAFCDYLDDTEMNQKLQIAQSNRGLAKYILHCNIEIAKKQELVIFITQYYFKFSFHFVVCIEENSAEEMIQAVSERLNNSYEEEIAITIIETKKLARHRLLKLIQQEYV